MRYIKVILIVIFFFIAMLFFFQNQASLSQEMVLTLNLFFIPTMNSIPLPFYFVVIAAFFIGAFLAWSFLLWDKVHISAKLMSSNWKVSNLEKELAKYRKQSNSSYSDTKTNSENIKKTNDEDITAPDPDKVA